MVGAGLIATTIPTIVGAGVVISVTDTVFRRGGKAVGTPHYHFTEKSGKAATRHRHEGGGCRHRHKGLFGYGRTRQSLKR